jgi:hypothetical protein
MDPDRLERQLRNLATVALSVLPSDVPKALSIADYLRAVIGSTHPNNENALLVRLDRIVNDLTKIAKLDQ